MGIAYKTFLQTILLSWAFFQLTGFMENLKIILYIVSMYLGSHLQFNSWLVFNRYLQQ